MQAHNSFVLYIHRTKSISVRLILFLPALTFQQLPDLAAQRFQAFRWVGVSVYVFMCVLLCVFLCVFLLVFLCSCVCASVRACVRVCVYVCVCVRAHKENFHLGGHLSLVQHW